MAKTDTSALAIVLVHGGFVDGSGWEGVYRIKMIPPPAQQFMSKRAGSTVVEVKASHAVYVSKPEAVASLIEEAANDVKLADKDRRRPQQEDQAQNAQAESAQVRTAPTEANRPGTR